MKMKNIDNELILIAMRKKDCKFLVGRNIDTHEEIYFNPIEADLKQKLLADLKNRLIEDKDIIDLSKDVADLLE